jgi:hypothetical protein
MKRLILSTLVLTGFAINANAQATATATATATIVTPISIVKDVDMNFGNIAVAAGSGGTVILAPAGTRTTGGTGITLPVVTGTVTAASFTVTGNNSYTYAITLPSSAVTLTGPSAATMDATAFTSTPSGTGTLSGGGTQNLLVGATLTVAAAQLAGVYTSGNFNVTVNYN